MAVDSITGIEITAAKLEQKTYQSNKEITIIDRNYMDRMKGINLSQLLNSVNGIQVNGAWSNASKDQSIYLRGAKNDYTMILIDGVPLTDPSGIGGAIDLRLLSLNQIDHLEIVKGAQTSLYGSDAIAGVINIITRKAHNDGVVGNANLAIGSFNSLDAGINSSYQTNTSKIGFSINRNSTKGISEAKDISSDKGFDNDGFNQVAYRIHAETKVSERLSLNSYYTYSKATGDHDGGSFTDSKDTYEARLNHVGIGSTIQHSLGTMKINASAQIIDRAFKTSFGDYQYHGKAILIDGFSDYRISKKLKFLIGVEFRKSNIQDEMASPKNPVVQYLAPYASILHNSGKFNFQIDGRSTYYKDIKSITYSFNPSYQLIRDLLTWRWSVGTGFKAPTLSQLYGPWGANPNLIPENGTTLESGMTYLSKSKHTRLSLTYFYRDIHHLIAYTNRYINLDRQKDQGIEINGHFKLNDKVSYDLGYMYQTGKFVTTTASGKDTTYNNLYRRPLHRLTHQFNFQFSKKVYSQLQWIYNGPSKDVDFNSFPSKQVDLTSYQVLNYSLHYHTGVHHVFISLNNLLNSDFQEVYGYSSLPFNMKLGYSITF